MAALPTQVKRNCVEAIRRDFPDWNVQRYSGFPRDDDRGKPSVYVAIDTGSVDPQADVFTGATYVDARIVAYMSWRITGSGDWEAAEDAAATLFGWFRAQPLHPDAQPSYPLDFAMIDEFTADGRPLQTRSLWHVSATIRLTLDAEETDADVYGLMDVPEPPVLVRDVWLTDGAGTITGETEIGR